MTVDTFLNCLQGSADRAQRQAVAGTISQYAATHGDRIGFQRRLRLEVIAAQVTRGKPISWNHQQEVKLHLAEIMAKLKPLRSADADA